MSSTIRIMIVDDDLTFLDSLENLLSKTFIVEACESAIEALEVRRDIRTKGGAIDLYITDQVMPGMQGIELLREIKADPTDRGLCMLLTAWADIKVASQGINEQIIDFYNNKPIEPNKLLKDIEQLLKRQKPSPSIFDNVSPRTDDTVYQKPQRWDEPSQNILITGATGFLGRHFISELLDKTTANIYAIVREKKGIPYDQRSELAGLLSNRLSIINGNIADQLVCDISGLPPIHEVWHLAGSTDFQEDRRVWTYKLNVDGVRNVVNLAKRLGTGRLYHVSTAYTAGITDKTVIEDALVNDPIFRNPYEETKYQGELIVRESGVPFIILKPSIIMGHTESGEAESDKMVYGVVKLYHRLLRLLQREYRDKGGIPPGIKYYVKGDPQARKNLIAVDDVVAMMLTVRECGDTGRTYHLCNPVPRNIQELHDTIQRILQMDLLSINTTLELKSQGDKKQAMIEKGVGVYEPYMVHTDPEFDLTNISQIFKINKVKLFTPELQEFLYQNYVARRLENSALLEENTAKLSRLPDLKRFGGQTLSYSVLYNCYKAFKISGIEGFLPFTMADGTAIMVGNPITDNPRGLVQGFIEMCNYQGFNPAAIQITQDVAQIFSDNEFLLNILGVETLIDLDQYDPSLVGKEYQQMRRWRNNAEKFSVLVEEKHLSRVNKLAVKEISDGWLKKKKNKFELCVLLRKLNLDDEPYVRRFFGKKDATLLGYIFFDPMFSNGNVVGYYANIERYFTEEPIHGLLPHIVMKSAERFKQEGVRYLSLGLSPLYRIHTNPFKEHEALRDIFQQFYNESTLYAFKGISEHKRKYPAKVESPVFFASRRDSSIDDIFNIFDSIGILKMGASDQNVN